MGCGLVDNSPFLRVAHSAHSPDDGVGIFSIVKWVLFQLSQFRRNRPSGYFLDCQMGTFSFDKHSLRALQVIRTSSRYVTLFILIHKGEK